uniref:Skp1-related protein n=1 Tax=Meloidogyne floridensis TaxID=298350 RepID=A0A915NV64_9BILA
MANNNNRILLKSNDDETFEVDRSVIRLSTTLNTMFQDNRYPVLYIYHLGMDQSDANDAMLQEPIPLANVNGAVLRKVIAWCQHHKDDPVVTDDAESRERRTDDIPSWDVEFLKNDFTPEEEEQIRRENAWCED